MISLSFVQTGILGVTYRLAQGVVKHIIPAVASTNAVVAAACALEVFKLASSCAPKLDNYMVFNDTDGENVSYQIFLSLPSFSFTTEEKTTYRRVIYSRVFHRNASAFSSSSFLLFCSCAANSLRVFRYFLSHLFFALFFLIRSFLPLYVRLVSFLTIFYLPFFFSFSSSAGIYTYTYAAERKENCVACSQIPKDLVFHENTLLSEVMEHLSTTYQMKGPGVTTTDKQGRNRTLYLPSVSSIEERTRPNLKKTLKGAASYGRGGYSPPPFSSYPLALYPPPPPPLWHFDIYNS